MQFHTFYNFICPINCKRVKMLPMIKISNKLHVNTNYYSTCLKRKKNRVKAPGKYQAIQPSMKYE